MIRRWGMLSILGLFVATGVALAQTPTTPKPTTPVFDKLSPGNQKIAQALCNAQKSGCTPSALDNIAATKLGGKGWGEIFHEMKAQGLVQGKNLGQVVREFEHQQRTPPTSGATTTRGSGRTLEVGEKGNAEGAVSKGKDIPERGSSGAVESGSSRGHGVGSEAAGMGGGHAIGGGAAGMGGGAGHLGGHGGGRGR